MKYVDVIFFDTKTRSFFDTKVKVTKFFYQLANNWELLSTF